MTDNIVVDQIGPSALLKKTHIPLRVNSEGLHSYKRFNFAAGFRINLIVLLIMGTTFSLPAAAKLYKWVDDKGITHYGEVIPPEYANKNRTELGNNGRILKEEEVLTPEQRLIKQQAEAKKQKEEEAAAEQKRHDTTLLNTYSNPKEIELARNRNLQQVNAHINAINSSIKMATDDLVGLQKETDSYKTGSTAIPNSLKDDLLHAQTKLDNLKRDLEKYTAERKQVNAKFDSDKARYIELTGKN